MKRSNRRLVEHEGHRVLVEDLADSDESPLNRYSIYKYVNGERFCIANIYPDDTKANRDTFIAEALRAFERARAAPFN